MIPVSVIILTKNEEEKIIACLKGLKDFNEINLIVLSKLLIFSILLSVELSSITIISLKSVSPFRQAMIFSSSFFVNIITLTGIISYSIMDKLNSKTVL